LSQLNTNDSYILGGVSYPLLSTVTSNDFRIWKVSGTIPSSRQAALYSGCSEFGRSFYTFGCGPGKSNMVTTIVYPASQLTITNSVTCNNKIAFDVIGDAGTKFMVQWTTNFCDWTSLSNTYTIDESRSKSVTNSMVLPMVFFRTATIPTIITNGWEIAPNTAGILRWGQNTFEGYVDYDGTLLSDFDLDGGPNECSGFAYDSGGGAFFQDPVDSNKWKLVALNEWVVQKFTTQDGRVLYGSMCDRRGLTSDGFTVPASWPVPVPVETHYSRIFSAKSWLDKYTGNAR
jgi:hypothetical protein